MVIVVMGEVGSGRDSVGRLLAESLGWEFADVESLYCAAQTRGSLTTAEPIPQVAALSAAIDSLTCEWRDVIVSCPTLREKDQRQLRRTHPLARFVYLKAPDRTDHSLLFDQPVDDDSVLWVDSSQEVERILGTVISALILKRRSSSVHAAQKIELA